MTQTPPAQKLSYDPGQQYGIVGIIMLAIGLPFIGIFLSIMGYKKSKKAGYQNTLAKVGIWLNAIVTILIVLGIVALVALINWGSYTTSFERAEDTAQAAQQIQAFVKDYSNTSGQFPDYEALVQEFRGSNIQDTVFVQTTRPAPGEVGYHECRGPDGSVVGVTLYFAEDYTMRDGEKDIRNTTTTLGLGECSSTR